MLKVLKLQAYPTLTAISSLCGPIARGASLLRFATGCYLSVPSGGVRFVKRTEGAGGVGAVIWDFDGTLADTSQRNLHVTRRIMESVTGREADSFESLRSTADYDAAISRSANWRELYSKEFGVTAAQTKEAGRLWSEFQLSDRTPVSIYDGIGETLAALAMLPHGILSQNARAGISETLDEVGLRHHFGCIVGYEQVPFEKQKPDPTGLFMCIEALMGSGAGKPTSGKVVYIGDHETDAQCAANANGDLRGRGSDMRVVTVAALYGYQRYTSDWAVTPDYTADSPDAVRRIVERLRVA